MENVAVLTKDGAFALFFRPNPGEFDSSSQESPPPGQPGGGRGGGWTHVKLTDALPQYLQKYIIELPILY